jgi:hypothetical protein
MSFKIDKARFRQAHQAFLEHMKKNAEGVPFASFSHRFFVTDEVSYKAEALRKGREALCLEKWANWLATPGEITAAMKEACSPSVSANLLEHRYGTESNSYSALYRLDSSEKLAAFEQQVMLLFQKSNQSEQEFGDQFDLFAEHLRENRLGCKWDFLAYLLFLLRPERCFPIKPTHFDKVIAFYGVDVTVSGTVSWSGYAFVLDVADALKQELLMYGTATAIEIQSYMWVVSKLLADIGHSQPAPPFDFAEELLARQRRDTEKQRIGLLGEKFVLESERARLDTAGRTDLANRVRLVSAEDDAAGYDVLSFSPDEAELHIEVKATTRGQRHEDVFWLSENEAICALSDPRWTVYRVWSVDSEPIMESLGNFILHEHPQWERVPASWLVRRKSDL